MRRSPLVLLLGAVACGPVSLDELPPEAFLVSPTYETHVRPLYEDYCTSCHTSLGQRAGGVELDAYESAHSRRVHSACVSVQEEVVARFASVLIPFQRSEAEPRAACEGWAVGSMPTGARSHLTLEEQVMLARWVELGAPR